MRGLSTRTTISLTDSLQFSSERCAVKAELHTSGLEELRLKPEDPFSEGRRSPPAARKAALLSAVKRKIHSLTLVATSVSEWIFRLTAESKAALRAAGGERRPSENGSSGFRRSSSSPLVCSSALTAQRSDENCSESVSEIVVRVDKPRIEWKSYTHRSMRGSGRCGAERLPVPKGAGSGSATARPPSDLLIYHASGSSIQKRVPVPVGAGSSPIRPPIRSIARCTMANPMPLPG